MQLKTENCELKTVVPTLAVIGGTGAEGSGLALRWAAAGYPVLIGSRSRERAQTAAAELTTLLPANGAAIGGEYERSRSRSRGCDHSQCPIRLSGWDS